MDFKTKLRLSVAANNSLACIGLDSDPAKLPAKFKNSKEPQFEFNKAIIDATADLVCAFKANSAFYEAAGAHGIAQLKKTVDYIHEKHPLLPFILDAKRADIGNTNIGYTNYAFEYLDVDAITLHPYLGGEAIEPFFAYKDRGLIVLCRTSNPGAGEFQDLEVDGKKLYQIVAERVRDKWNSNGNCLLVVGATYPREMAEVRALVGDDMTFLVPGIGTQGGDIEATIRAGISSRGDGLIVHSSRDIIFASDNADFAKVARERAELLREKINLYRFKALILELNKIGVVKFGEFTFKSGIISPMYIDLRILVSYPDTMKKVAKAYTSLLQSLDYDRLAGIPYAAMPIAAAVAAETKQPWIYTRKEAKGYGLNKMIEGEYEAGETIAVIDDLITTGASKFEVIKPFEKAGLKVKDVIVLINYEKGGDQTLKKRGYKLHSLFTVSDIIESLAEANVINPAMAEKARQFLASS